MGRVSILEMSCEDAKKFFLKEKSYCNIDLPKYFSFAKLLEDIDCQMDSIEGISDVYDWKLLKKCENVNHTLFANKDGKLSWRPLQIIHPFIYVLLVREITHEDNWGEILERFRRFQENDKIKCFSIPVESESNQSDKAEQVLQWWEKIEQESISLSLEFKYSYDTDIADCYGSIYTHSIAWATETREKAKENKNNHDLLGNKIDDYIQGMQYGQTNGIPQGSVLMDFIAEIVLGYIDELLSKKIEEKKIHDYKILRYRDDYKIFVNSPNDGELILKLLAELIVPFGFKLNSSKTRENTNIISRAVKPDKLAWFQLSLSALTLQKQFLLIHQHSLTYPNSGSVVRGLTELGKRISDEENSIQIISIVVDIMLHNPRSIPICCSIISKILKNTSEDIKKTISTKIHHRLMEISNSELAQIWLQRMLKEGANEFELTEKLCKIVKGEKIEIWESRWISGKKFRSLMESSIFDETKFNEMDNVINDNEVSLFEYK